MIYFLLILGAIVGSFLNVCIYRLPRQESVISPPSHCPRCGGKLSVLDLVPVFGYLLLRGKCRYCGERISPRYPLIELLTALGFALCWLNAKGEALSFVFQAVFISVLLVVFFTDLEHQVIPDAASFLGIFSGLIYNLFRGLIFSALFGALTGYALLFLVGRAGKAWFKKEVMGEGDLYVAALLGAYLGWDGALLSLFLAYLLAAAVSLVFLAAGKIKFGQYIPFGPALAAGGAAALFFGPGVTNWYFSLFL